MTGHFHCGILFSALFLPFSAISSAVLPNAKCQNSTLPKLSNSPRDFAKGAIHDRGWFHGLTRRSNRLEFKKGNSGALLAMSLGIGVRIEGICETDEAKKTVRETRCGDGKYSRISCRSNRDIYDWSAENGSRALLRRNIFSLKECRFTCKIRICKTTPYTFESILLMRIEFLNFLLQ